MGEYVNYEMEILFDSEKNAGSFCIEKDVWKFLGCGDYANEGKSVSCKVFDVWQKSSLSKNEQTELGLKAVLEKYRDKIRHFRFWVQFPERAPEEEVKLEKILGKVKK